MLNFCHLASISNNTNNMLKINLCHLASSLIITDDILKVVSYHLTSILTNTDDKANNFTRKRLVTANQLLTLYYWVIIENNSFIPQQVDNLQIYT